MTNLIELPSCNPSTIKAALANLLSSFTNVFFGTAIKFNQASGILLCLSAQLPPSPRSLGVRLFLQGASMVECKDARE